jgi:hypothetical protein
MGVARNAAVTTSKSTAGPFRTEGFASRPLRIRTAAGFSFPTSVCAASLKELVSAPLAPGWSSRSQAIRAALQKHRLLGAVVSHRLGNFVPKSVDSLKNKPDFRMVQKERFELSCSCEHQPLRLLENKALSSRPR